MGTIPHGMYTRKESDDMKFPLYRDHSLDPNYLREYNFNIDVRDTYTPTGKEVYGSPIYNGKIKLIVEDPLDYPMNAYADRYTQIQRMSAKNIRRDVTPVELWQNLEQRWKIVSSLKNRGDYWELRDAMWNSDASGECNGFPISRYLGILSVLCDGKPMENLSLLDPCAGWGDRACAAGKLTTCKYLGFDPNPDLVDGYREIMQDFPTVRLITCPFEDAEISENKYDYIITSPPYFDHEIYNPNDKNQSMYRYPTLQSWYKNFLNVMMLKCFRALKPGGKMAIHIVNSGRMPDGVERAKSIMGSLGNQVTYNGIIGLMSTRWAPVFVWTKNYSQTTQPFSRLQT